MTRLLLVCGGVHFSSMRRLAMKVIHSAATPLLGFGRFRSAHLDIYRKYYGLKMSAFLFVVFYAAMVGAALVVEFAFGLLHLIPEQRNAQVMEEAVRWNYTSVLNILFLIPSMILLVRFARRGGPEMLRMMNILAINTTNVRVQRSIVLRRDPASCRIFITKPGTAFAIFLRALPSRCVLIVQRVSKIHA
jgi:hypothetical protein